MQDLWISRWKRKDEIVGCRNLVGSVFNTCGSSKAKAKIQSSLQRRQLKKKDAYVERMDGGERDQEINTCPSMIIL